MTTRADFPPTSDLSELSDRLEEPRFELEPTLISPVPAAPPPPPAVPPLTPFEIMMRDEIRERFAASERDMLTVREHLRRLDAMIIEAGRESREQDRLTQTRIDVLAASVERFGGDVQALAKATVATKTAIDDHLSWVREYFSNGRANHG